MDFNIAVLGYGTVGSGVVEVFNREQDSIDKMAGCPVRIKYVLDIRDLAGSPIENILTHNIDDILNDEEVRAVVEVMGGLEPSYTYVKKALLKGKNVVTSNKELVARHGAELLELARSLNVNFLFEASVGGGIPLIRPLQDASWDEIYEISGILNGTTNYILTKMSRGKGSLDEVLAEAQALGYAEKNPSADLNGDDACRKIAILLSLALGKKVSYESIHTEGITGISAIDLSYAKALGGTLKLLARAVIKDTGIFARVAPAIVLNDDPLAMVGDTFNAVTIKGPVIDELMFYGRGAGKLPTAGAVVTNIIDCAKHPNENMGYYWSSEEADLLPIGKEQVRKLVRVGYSSEKEKEAAIEAIGRLFPSDKAVILEEADDEFAFTAEGSEDEIEEKLSRSPLAIRNTIRFHG